ncbi:MAG: hypothetical protein WCS65_02960 [Verrucomicrobiae bacterium]
MKTSFREIDFPAGTGSLGEPRLHEGDGWKLVWSYPDEIGARAIGMDMPNVLNPGPTAAKITFFALMAATARVNWTEKFSRPSPKAPPLPG